MWLIVGLVSTAPLPTPQGLFLMKNRKPAGEKRTGTAAHGSPSDIHWPSRSSSANTNILFPSSLAIKDELSFYREKGLVFTNTKCMSHLSNIPLFGIWMLRLGLRI